MKWRRWRRHANIDGRLQAEGFQPYDRDDFEPLTRGGLGACARRGRHLEGNRPALVWQRATASGALFAYCAACAWELMLEIRAKRMRGMRRDEATGRLGPE